MSNDKDLGSDAARSDPDTADRDREELRRRAELNVEQSRGRLAPNDVHPAREAEEDCCERTATRTDEFRPEPTGKASGKRLGPGS